MFNMPKLFAALIVGTFTFAMAGLAHGAQGKVAPGYPDARAAEAEEIVVVGRRSGVPIWRVQSGQSNLVLVGTINGVTKDTKWDPTSLVEALRRADRVMFPQMQRVKASPLAMLGYLAKWRRQATLPEKQSLANYLTAEQFQRLVRLQRKGIAKRGSEKTHPLHLAMNLRATAKGRVGYGEDPDQYVMRAIGKYKLRLLPIQKRAAKPLANELFEGSPSRHVPCLVDAITMAEAGPAAVALRSQDWARGRVAEVLRSPAEKVYQSCFPADLAREAREKAAFHSNIARVLTEPQLTVAVLDLHSLAGRGGVLDSLVAEGHHVQGPQWK